MKKSISFYTILVALSAFVGVICDGIAAKTPMGSFYVTNGVTGATGASASAEWLANHSGATLEDYWNFLRMKPTGSVESCNDLPSSANVGDMYLVKDGSNTRMCVYYATGFPACPSGCGLMNAAQGPDGADGCDPDVTLAPSTADNRCYVLTVTNKTRGANGCETSGTPQTQTVCHGDDGKDACFLQKEVSVMANSGQVDTGCKQEQRMRGVLQSNGTCDTTGYNWENFGDPRCPACEVQTQELPKDANGCIQVQTNRGVRGSDYQCEYPSANWENSGKTCDACRDDKVLISSTRNSNRCLTYNIFKQKKNASGVCVHDGDTPDHTEEGDCLAACVQQVDKIACGGAGQDACGDDCVGYTGYAIKYSGCANATPAQPDKTVYSCVKPGPGHCDGLTSAEKQITTRGQTSTRVNPGNYNSNANYFTSLGGYEVVTTPCEGNATTNFVQDDCKVLAVGGTKGATPICRDGTYYSCNWPTNEAAITGVSSGKYFACVSDPTIKPIQPSCVTEESAYDVPSTSQTITGTRNGNSENLTFYTNVGKTVITKTNNCTGGSPEVIDTEDKCYENTTDTDLIMTDTSTTYRGYTCYTCVHAGGSLKGTTYTYCKNDNNSASHKIKEKIDAVNTELSGKLTSTDLGTALANASLKPTLANAVSDSVDEKLNTALYGSATGTAATAQSGSIEARLNGKLDSTTAANTYATRASLNDYALASSVQTIAEDYGRIGGAAAVSDNDLVEAVVNFVRASCFDSGAETPWSISGACGAVPQGVRSSVQNYSRN